MRINQIWFIQLYSAALKVSSNVKNQCDIKKLYIPKFAARWKCDKNYFYDHERVPAGARCFVECDDKYEAVFSKLNNKLKK